MIDQDKMRALATRLREDYDFSLSITSTRYRDAVSRTPIEAADAIDLLLAEVEAAAADKRDAERYRHLRAYYTRISFMNDSGLDIDLKAAAEIGDAYEMQVLDQAIDAALAQRQGEGS